MKTPRTFARSLTLWIAFAAFAPRADASLLRREFWQPDGVVRATAIADTTLYLGGDFSYVGPDNGFGQPVDPVSGEVLSGSPQIDGPVNAVVSDGANGWFVGGSFTHVGGLARGGLAHILADGSVAAFDPQPNNMVRALALSGSVLYVAGDFSSIGGQTRNGVAAIDASSGLATSWDAAVSASLHSVHSLAVAGGSVYFGGLFFQVAGQSRALLASVDATTGALRSWNPAPDQPVDAMVVGDSTLYISGPFAHVGGQPHAGVAGVSLTTGAPRGWGFSATNGNVFALAYRAGVVYAGGDFISIGGASRLGLAALDARTGVATGFDLGLTPGGPASPVRALSISGLTLYAAGGFTTVSGETRGHLAAFDLGNNAQLLPWDPGAANPLALGVSPTRIFVAGASVGGAPRARLAALSLRTGRLTAWAGPADLGGVVEALTPYGASLIVGGALSGPLASNLIWVNRTTGIATAPLPVTGGDVSHLAPSGFYVFFSGSFTAVHGVARPGLAATDIASQLNAWNPTLNGIVTALAAGIDYAYIAGGFTSVNGTGRFHAAGFDLASASVDAWNPAPDGGDCHVLVFADSIVYAGGKFTSFGGQVHERIAAVDALSGLATNWHPVVNTINGDVLAIAPGSSEMVFGGDFQSVNFATQRYIAAVHPASGATLPWNPNPNGVVRSISLASGTAFVGGDFTNIDGVNRSYLAALVLPEALDVPPTPATDAAFAAHAGPNPFAAATRIAFTLPARARVTLRLFDVGGREVAAPLRNEWREAGSQAVSLERQGLAAGLYFYRLEAGGRTASGRLAIVAE